MDSIDYGAGEKIDRKIYEDYESEDFDISGVVDDFDLNRDAEPIVDEARPEGDSFIDPDEKLKDWEFDGLEVEKHSKGSRSRRRKQKKQERAEAREEKAWESEDAQKIKEAEAAEEARAAEEERAAVEAQLAEEARAAEEEKLAEEARAVEEARREAQQQEAFERISRTVQAPIASSIVGDAAESAEAAEANERETSAK